jgi:hypothetical protein
VAARQTQSSGRDRPPPLIINNSKNLGGGLARTLRGWRANEAFVN